MNDSSARTYVLYRDAEGVFTPRWREGVPGCTESYYGVFPPPFPLVVRATSEDQACALANASITSSIQRHDLGIWWDRSQHEGEAPPPLGKDLRQYWTTISYCDGCPMAEAHETLRNARERKDWQDTYGCANGCDGRSGHRIELMTTDEAERREFYDYIEPFPLWEGAEPEKR